MLFGKLGSQSMASQQADRDIPLRDIQWASTSVDVSGVSVMITNSQISNYQSYGIRLQGGAGGLIANNVITGANTGYGIYMIDAAVDVAGYGLTISGNRITNNYQGIRINKHSSPVINGNSVYSNTNYDLYAYRYASAGTVTIDATGNWWGTTDIATITSNIYDNNEHYQAPIINFLPMLDSAP